MNERLLLGSGHGGLDVWYWVRPVIV
jgi:hypothetical protein